MLFRSFSFLQGASTPEALVDRAARLGYPALALVDADGVYGAPRFYKAATKAGVRAIVGAELTIDASGRMQGASSRGARSPVLSSVPIATWRLPVLVESAEGYRNLCRLVTRMKMRAEKGQGALVLENAKAAEHPFFEMAPSWALLPLVGLATAAAIIASQALISGAFSLTRQAIQLGYAPRLDISHTSSEEIGQVYVPQVNWALMFATIVIVLGFRSSGSLAAAYGIAVTMTMIITALLLHVVATERWGWPKPVAFLVTGLFLTIDFAFFGANLIKVLQGGWLPLVIGGLIFTLMTTWKTGRRLVAERLTARAIPLEVFMAGIAANEPVRVPGTAVFMTAQPKGTPPALAHNLRYNKVLHEHVVVLSVSTSATPYVEADDHVRSEEHTSELQSH